MPDPDETTGISELRHRFDNLDLELFRLLNERAQCAIEIGRIKRKHRIPIYDPQREEEIARMMTRKSNGPLDAAGVRRFLERIVDESRRVERISAEREDCGLTGERALWK